MSKLIQCRLSRLDNSPWGFRLQGGKDFGTPLIVQKVHGNSLAERAGLMAGDALIRVNNTDVYNMKHKDAQNVLVKAGNSFELTVSRGGSVWKPQVTVVNNSNNRALSGRSPVPATKVSLEYNQSNQNQSQSNSNDFQEAVSRHNSVPKPFSPTSQMSQVNSCGTIDRKKFANNQYNSPVALYSDKTIAETLSAQAEVLETGALGVNFKKNERNYDSSNSEVYKVVQEEYQHTDHNKVKKPTRSPVLAISTFDKPLKNINENCNLALNVCHLCKDTVMGVFVRIKDKNLHVECFKCSTCGSSLKNVGYYNINEKLYCDIHAKLIAKSNHEQQQKNQPANTNLIPITISSYENPNGNRPSGNSCQSPAPQSPSSVYSTSSYQQSKRSTSVTPRCPMSPANNNGLGNASQHLTSTSSKSYCHSSSTMQKSSTISSRNSEQDTDSNYSDTNQSAKLDEGFVTKSECPLLKSELEELALRNNRRLKLADEFRSKPKTNDFIHELINDIFTISCPSEITEEEKVGNESWMAKELMTEKPEKFNDDCFIELKPNDKKFQRFTDSPMLVSDNIANKQSALLRQLNPEFFDTKLFRFANYEKKLTETVTNQTGSLNNNYGGSGGGRRQTNAAVGVSPRRGRGVFNANSGPGARTPQCAACSRTIRGPFITALGKIWCPEHFVCSIANCQRPLQDLGFVEDSDRLYCEFCFERFLAPSCERCRSKIKGDCLKAIGKHFHPECFVCTHCNRQFGNSPFFLEDDLPYCESDWNQLFTTKCIACGFPVEGGDRWVEALGSNYHSQCFNCTTIRDDIKLLNQYSCRGFLAGDVVEVLIDDADYEILVVFDHDSKEQWIPKDSIREFEYRVGEKCIVIESNVSVKIK